MCVCFKLNFTYKTKRYW